MLLKNNLEVSKKIQLNLANYRLLTAIFVIKTDIEIIF